MTLSAATSALGLDSKHRERKCREKYLDKYGYEVYLKYYCPLTKEFGYNLAGVRLPVPPPNEIPHKSKKKEAGKKHDFDGFEQHDEDKTKGYWLVLEGEGKGMYTTHLGAQAASPFPLPLSPPFDTRTLAMRAWEANCAAANPPHPRRCIRTSPLPCPSPQQSSGKMSLYLDGSSSDSSPTLPPAVKRVTKRKPQHPARKIPLSANPPPLQPLFDSDESEASPPKKPRVGPAPNSSPTSTASISSASSLSASTTALEDAVRSPSQARFYRDPVPPTPEEIAENHRVAEELATEYWSIGRLPVHHSLAHLAEETFPGHPTDARRYACVAPTAPTLATHLALLVYPPADTNTAPAASNITHTAPAPAANANAVPNTNPNPHAAPAPTANANTDTAPTPAPTPNRGTPNANPTNPANTNAVLGTNAVPTANTMAPRAAVSPGCRRAVFNSPTLNPLPHSTSVSTPGLHPAQDRPCPKVSGMNARDATRASVASVGASAGVNAGANVSARAGVIAGANVSARAGARVVNTSVNIIAMAPTWALAVSGVTAGDVDAPAAPRTDANPRAQLQPSALVKFGLAGLREASSPLQRPPSAAAVKKLQSTSPEVFYNKEKRAVYKSFDIGFADMGAHESLRAMSASKAVEEIKSAPKSSRATGKTKKPNNILTCDMPTKKTTTKVSSTAASRYNPSGLPMPPHTTTFDTYPPASRAAELEKTIAGLDSAILAEQGIVGAVTVELEKKEEELEASVQSLRELLQQMKDRAVLVREEDDKDWCRSDEGCLRQRLRCRAAKNSPAHRRTVAVHRLQKARTTTKIHDSDRDDSEITTEVMEEANITFFSTSCF
ncbi:hypothetical protein C8J57DRAFT_1240178 [Mycena rebaudengoi]|nr:hypothetical protein C8J57DRAFT_1240178 [Mycena rebaudengoi]